MRKTIVANFLIIALLGANIFYTTQVHAARTVFGDDVQGESFIVTTFAGNTQVDVARGETYRSPVWYQVEVYTVAETSCGGTWHPITSASATATYRALVQVQTQTGGTVSSCPDSTYWQNRTYSHHSARHYTNSSMTWYGQTSVLSPVRSN